MRTGHTWNTRKTKKMMQMRALNEDRTHMEDPKDRKNDENESLE
jgi:hypothetical protein